MVSVAAIAVISYSLFPSFPPLYVLLGDPYRGKRERGRRRGKGIGDHCNCCIDADRAV